MFLYFLIFFMTYHLTGVFTSYRDMIQKDVQGSVNTVKKYIKGYRQVMFNTGFVTYVVFGVASRFLEVFDGPFVRHVEIIKYMSCLFILDFARYFLHRLFHCQFMYERFHHVNHQYVTCPMWLLAYTHWFDWICCYLCPALIPLVIVQLHPYTLLFWIFTITLASVTPINDFRSLHYIFSNRFFSTGLLADRLFGSVS